jgi:putative methyltransferase (TIGR04325 family)
MNASIPRPSTRNTHGLRAGAAALARSAARAVSRGGSQRLPLIGGLIASAYGRYFNGVQGHARLFRGIYPDFASAERDVPQGRFVGYDNEPSAHRLVDDRSEIFPYDYPVMFWLSKLLPESGLLFDWGGNVGIKYFTYRRYLAYPDRLVWCVNDVPAIVALGEQIAAQESAPGLCFTTTLDAIAEADVLFAAGSIHFIEDPLAALRQAKALPRHLLLSKVPAYDRPSAVTLQNMGTAFCPNHLFNRDELVASIEALGYRLVDEWRSPDLACDIPFFPEHSIKAYSGFYFTAR